MSASQIEQDLFGAESGDEDDQQQQQSQPQDESVKQERSSSDAAPADAATGTQAAILSQELFGDSDDEELPQAPAVVKQEGGATTIQDLFGEDAEVDEELMKEAARRVAEEEKQRQQEKKEEEGGKKHRRKSKIGDDSSGSDEESDLRRREGLYQKSRMHERDELEQAMIKAEGPLSTIQTIVKTPLDSTDPHTEMVLVKLPNVIGIQSKRFDPETYEMEEEEKAPPPVAASQPASSPTRTLSKPKSEKTEKSKRKKNSDSMDVDDEDEEDAQQTNEVDEAGNILMKEDQQPVDVKVKLSVENIIRWRHRRDEATGQLIKESNARLVKFEDGSRYLYLGNEVFLVNSDKKPPNRNLCLQTMNGIDGIRKGVGSFTGSIGFRVLNIASASHQKLKEKIQLTHVRQPKIQRRYDMIAEKDMQATTQIISQLEKTDELKRRQRERANERERLKRSGGGEREREKRGSRITAEDLEEEDDDEEEFTRSSSSAAKRKRADESDEEEEDRLVKAKNAAYDDDGEEGETLKKEQAADEEIVIRKGKSKRRKIDDDEEDDDE